MPSSHFANLLSLLFLLVFCDVASAKDTLYRDKEAWSSFKFPSEWERKPSRTQLYKAIVGDKNAFGGNCMYAVNYSAELLKYTDQAATDATSAKDIENGARNSGNPITITKFSRTLVGNRPAIYYESSAHYQSLLLRIPVRTMAVVVKVQDRIYTLGCTAGEEVMPTLAVQFYGILSSLIIAK